jgi:predicted nucleic-acid-binding protein
VIGLETNVLVRFLTNDDRDQALAAKHLLENRTATDPAYVNLIVLVETLWVLRRAYAYSGADARQLVAKLLAKGTLRFERARLIEKALATSEQYETDLPDTLIAMLNSESGCAGTVTFDQRATRIPGMVPLETRGGIASRSFGPGLYS